MDPSWSLELSRYTAVTYAWVTTSRGLNPSFIFSKCLCFIIFQILWEKTPATAALFLLQAGKSTPNIQSIKWVTLSLLALLSCPKWSKLEPYSASHRNYPAPGAWGAASNRLWRKFTLPERREPGQEHTVSRNKGKVMKATIAKIHNSAFCLVRVFCFPMKSGMFEYTTTFTLYFPQTEANEKYQSTNFAVTSSIKALETKPCFNYSGTVRIHV